MRQLEIALDLNPEHRKAMGYLGLALLESGHVARARDWFGRAGETVPDIPETREYVRKVMALYQSFKAGR